MADEQQNTSESSEQPQEGAEQQQDEAKTFDAEYVEKLRKEAAKYRTEAKANANAAKQLAEIEDAKKTQSERDAERIAEAEKRATDAEAILTRMQVAVEKGLTPNQARRLVGSTREELEADADELLADIGAQNAPRAPRPDPNQGRNNAGTATTADQFAAAVGGFFNN